MRWIVLVLMLFAIYQESLADMIDDAVHEAIADTVRKPLRDLGMKEDAVQGLSRGLAATKPISEGKSIAKRTKKYVERRTYKKVKDITGIKREHAAVVLVVGMGLTQGKVGTKGIKYRIKPTKGMTIRPDVMYNWRGREISSTVNLKWGF